MGLGNQYHHWYFLHTGHHRPVRINFPLTFSDFDTDLWCIGQCCSPGIAGKGHFLQAFTENPTVQPSLLLFPDSYGYDASSVQAPVLRSVLVVFSPPRLLLV